MKRMTMRFAAILAVLLLSTGVSNATNINRQQAAKLAREFMSKKFSENSATRRATQTISLSQVETEQSLVYAFNVEDGGFVVVSGSDLTECWDFLPQDNWTARCRLP